MKRIVFILLGTMVFALHAQDVNKDDVRARIHLYVQLHPEIFNVQVTSPEAKSITNLIVDAFEQYQVVPTLNLDAIKSANEKEEIISLQKRLSDLLHNPPTWDKLAQTYHEKLTAPPTPPVYAGDAKANAFYNAKLNRQAKVYSIESSSKVVRNSSVTSLDTTKKVDPPKK
jgi:hypothetical protein